MRIGKAMVALTALGCVLAIATNAPAQRRGRGQGRKTQGPPTQMAEEKTGIKVGQKVPDFKLLDQNAKPTALADLLKRSKWTALVFFRSADW